MKFTKKRRSSDEILTSRDWDAANNENRFTSIIETYRVFSLAMVIALMYPNPGTERRRLVYLVVLIASFIPAYVMWFYDVSICIREMDIDTLTRQLSLGVPIMFCQFKSIFIYIVRNGVKEIFDEIDQDYERANHVHPDYQTLVKDNRTALLRVERYWKWVVISTVSMFTIVAVVMTIDAYILKEPRRYMIHEMRIPWIHEKSWETPYFEIIFIYSMYVSFVLMMNYMSYDGMFYVCIYHCCLKFTLVGKMFSKAFENINDVEGIKRNLVLAVEEHCKAYSFVQVITRSYEVWLALVFALTVSQVCMNMYQIITSDTIDPTYIIFLVSATLHIYVPCYFVSKLTATSAEVADTVYCSGWERVRDREVRRNVAFIIARAQIPVEINAFDMLCFNMSLFVNVMQTSYSVFTLLRS